MHPRLWLLRFGLPLIGTLGTFTSASAGQAEIMFARLIEDAPGWRVEVTLRHADAGWDHYANAWRIIADNGQVIGEPVLHHPHVNEQPQPRTRGSCAIA